MIVAKTYEIILRITIEPANYGECLLNKKFKDSHLSHYQYKTYNFLVLFSTRVCQRLFDDVNDIKVFITNIL